MRKDKGAGTDNRVTPPQTRERQEQAQVSALRFLPRRQVFIKEVPLRKKHTDESGPGPV